MIDDYANIRLLNRKSTNHHHYLDGHLSFTTNEMIDYYNVATYIVKFWQRISFIQLMLIMILLLFFDSVSINIAFNRQNTVEMVEMNQVMPKLLFVHMYCLWLLVISMNILSKAWF